MSALTFSNFTAISVSLLAYFFLSNDYFISYMARSLSQSSGFLNPIFLIGGFALALGLIARAFVHEILADSIED
jgi:hypothetical protein